jgi:hypothetical protein
MRYRAEDLVGNGGGAVRVQREDFEEVLAEHA